VLATLAELGYGLAWRVVDSRFFGVPQRRRRVFIVGALADGDPRTAAERAGAVLAVGSRCKRHPPTGSEEGKDPAAAPARRAGDGGGQLASTVQRGNERLDVDSAESLVAQPHYYVEDFEDGTLTSSQGRVDRHPLLPEDGTSALASALEASDGKHASSPRGDAGENLLPVAEPVTYASGEQVGDRLGVAPTIDGRAGNGPRGNQGSVIVAGPLATGQTPRGHGQAGVNDQAVEANHVVAEATAGTLKAQDGRGWSYDPEATYVPALTGGNGPFGPRSSADRLDDQTPLISEQETSATLKGQRGRGGGGIGPEETLLAVPISQDATRGEGEARTPSADAEGRVRLRDPGLGVGDEGDPAFTISASAPGAVAAPLSAGGHPNSNVPGRRKEDDENLVVGPDGQAAPFGFYENQGSTDTPGDPGEAPSLKATGSKMAVANAPLEPKAFDWQQGNRDVKLDDVAEHHRTDGQPAVLAASSVRRLTPRECERLQGLPDDWTLIAADSPDSRRYSGLGDAVTATVARWIGERIASELS